MFNKCVFLVGWRTESSVSDGWLILLEGAHNQWDTPVLFADVAAEIHSWHSTCFASCSPLVIVGFAWQSSNSWAPLWSVMCQAQTCLLLTPRLETNQVSHAFNLTFGKAWIPFLNRVANGSFRLKELAMQLNRSKQTKPELRATPWGRCGWCKDE